MAELQDGFVLHSRPYRESSLIIELFTRKDGRIPVIAKGARKNKVWRGIAAPFTKLKLNFHGKSELKTLNYMEEFSSFRLGQLSLYSGYYVNELIIKILPVGAGCSELFGVYESTLRKLASSGTEKALLEAGLREFEFALLEEMGKGLNFTEESISGNQVLSGQSYLISYDTGIEPYDAKLPAREINSEIITSGRVLLSIASRKWDSCSLATAKKINRCFINQFLGATPLYSRKLIRDYIEVMSV